MIGAGYLAVGVLLVFVGPAATALDRERMRLLFYPVWKQQVFHFTIAAAIVVFWPFLVPSAHRSNGYRNTRRTMSPVLSETGRLRIEEARRHAPRTLSIEEYERIGSDLEFADYLLLRQEMDRLGYTVDAAETDTGERIPLSLKAMSEIGSAIRLSRPRNEGDGGPSKNGLWVFTNDADHWEHLAGRSGEAEVRNGVVVKINVTMMS